MNMKLLECVPNFSEGCDWTVIRSIAQVLEETAGVALLDYSADVDHHRSVFTFIGKPDDILAAALAAAGRAFEQIDMRAHGGAHPRLGAVDVVPFIPLGEAEMKDAVKIAHRFGRELHRRFGVPVYFYAEAALTEKRRQLADVRRGGYEALGRKIADPREAPDIGGPDFDPRWGATAVGARLPLVAYNINLASGDIHVARAIAAKIREAAGGIKHVRAIGLLLKTRNIAQVSMNLVDCRETSLKEIFDQVRDLAAAYGVDILESELIGLTPACALSKTTPEALKLRDFTEDKILENHVSEMKARFLPH